MIGDMIAKIRKEKGITKTELARRTGINIGHLTHIEKGERNPSQNALKNICKALNINSDFLFSDLIDSDCPSLDNLIDNNFLESYIKLDEKNKKIIHLFTEQLVKIQNEEKLDQAK